MLMPPKQTLHYLSWHHHLPKGKRESVLAQFSWGKLSYYTCTIPFSLGLAHFVLHVSSSLPFDLRTSLKHPFRRQRCLRVLLLVLSKRRTNKYGWLVMINGWKHPGSVTSDPQCKTMVYNSGVWVSMFRPCSPSVDHSIQLGRKWRERELKFSGAS